MIDQITIIGTGLIGGSLGLALKRAGFAGRIIGCDRVEVLGQALRRGAIDIAETSPDASVSGSQIVVLATPVLSILDLITRLAGALAIDALLTDTGSTKVEITRQAQKVFGESAERRFLPGHPMAGKESGGIERADATLFADATWVLTPTGRLGAIEQRATALRDAVATLQPALARFYGSLTDEQKARVNRMLMANTNRAS